MPAQPESYAIASGEVLSGGRFRLPDWVPSVGEIVDVSLNTIYDVRDGSSVGTIYEAWSGNAYLPDLGQYGSILSMGGGHSDGTDNGIWRYDVETRLHSKIKNGAAVYHDADGYIGDQTTGWMWGDTGGLTKQVGEPFTAHFYANILGLPASALAGHAQGLLFTSGRAAMPLPGQRGTTQSHKYDPLSNQWTLHGSALPFGNAYGPTLYDSLRSRVASLDGGNYRNQLEHVDLSTGASASLALSDYVSGYYATGSYNETHDVYQSVVWGGSLNILLIHPTTGFVTRPATSGTPPTTDAVGGWEWVEAWQALIYYPGSGLDVWTLRAPDNPLAGAWTWGKQTLTGIARSLVSSPHYNRIKYVPGIDTFIWCARTDQPNQAFRISAP